MDKIDYTLLDHNFIMYMAKVMTRGATKSRNTSSWHDTPQHENMKSLSRHYHEYARGYLVDDDDPTVPIEAKIACRLMMAWYIREAKRLEAETADKDLPKADEWFDQYKKEYGDVGDADDFVVPTWEDIARRDEEEKKNCPFVEPDPPCPVCGDEHKNEVCW